MQRPPAPPRELPVDLPRQRARPRAPAPGTRPRPAGRGTPSSEPDVGGRGGRGRASAGRPCGIWTDPGPPGSRRRRRPASRTTAARVGTVPANVRSGPRSGAPVTTSATCVGAQRRVVWPGAVRGRHDGPVGVQPVQVGHLRRVDPAHGGVFQRPRLRRARRRAGAVHPQDARRRSAGRCRSDRRGRRRCPAPRGTPAPPRRPRPRRAQPGRRAAPIGRPASGGRVRCATSTRPSRTSAVATTDGRRGERLGVRGDHLGPRGEDAAEQAPQQHRSASRPREPSGVVHRSSSRSQGADRARGEGDDVRERAAAGPRASVEVMPSGRRG